jgi:hypothetical protein
VGHLVEVVEDTTRTTSARRAASRELRPLMAVLCTLIDRPTGPPTASRVVSAEGCARRRASASYSEAQSLAVLRPPLQQPLKNDFERQSRRWGMLPWSKAKHRYSLTPTTWRPCSLIRRQRWSVHDMAYRAVFAAINHCIDGVLAKLRAKNGAKQRAAAGNLRRVAKRVRHSRIEAASGRCFAPAVIRLTSAADRPLQTEDRVPRRQIHVGGQ